MVEAASAVASITSASLRRNHLFSNSRTNSCLVKCFETEIMSRLTASAMKSIRRCLELAAYSRISSMLNGSGCLLKYEAIHSRMPCLSSSSLGLSPENRILRSVIASLLAKLPNTVAVVRRADAYTSFSIVNHQGGIGLHQDHQSLSNPKVHPALLLNTKSITATHEQQPP